MLNALFIGVETKAFQSIGLSPVEAANKAIDVNQALAVELLVVLGFIALFIIVRLTLAVESPTRHNKSPR